ncbi:MAG: hypothetical protein AB8B49_11575 [Nitratireductor sp.]
MKTKHSLKIVFIIASMLLLPNFANAEDEKSRLEGHIFRTKKCLKAAQADPGGLDAISICHWIYDDLKSEMAEKNSPKMLNAMMYLEVQNINALIAGSMARKTEVDKLTCKYMSERIRIKKAYKPNLTIQFDKKMILKPLSRPVAEKCSSFFATAK